MPNRSLVLKCRLCASLRDICLRYMTAYLVSILVLARAHSRAERVAHILAIDRDTRVKPARRFDDV